jgi:Protein of unknown function (DUF3048).
MKRLFLILTVLTLCILVVACGPNETEPTPTAVPTPTATPVATPSPAPVPTPSPTPAPPLSYTTGLPFDGEYQPVMVVIENSPQARPQLGLQTADVVYEVPIEASITRFVCVFSDNIPEKVMPVRSGRVTFLYIQQEWDTMFLHWGGSGERSSLDYTFFGNNLHDKIRLDFDGNRDKHKDILYHKDGKDSTHNVIAELQLAQQKYDYSPAPLSWLFDSSASYSGDTVTEIELAMCSNDSNFISYTYDAANDVYLRFMNGKVFESAETGQQVSVKNVIVQYSTYSQYGILKDWKMIGGGNADIYIGGVLIKGTWEKASAADPTIFRDANGNQIVLRPGNTWIHISPKA